MEKVETEVGGQVSTGGLGYCSFCFISNLVRTAAGVKFRIKCKDEGRSFSVLVPGQKSLL